MPAASTILMIRPAAFAFNAETAANNFFQNEFGGSGELLQLRVLEEFDQMVSILRSKDIEVLVVDDTRDPPKPDAVFPNNWIATSPEGKIFVFPMFARSRRREKRADILELLAGQFRVADVQDWSEFEAEGRFLEGTGSMVMDHVNKMIYAAVSERTSLPVLEKFAARNGYQAVVFLATDRHGRPVYHTNVVMSLNDSFAVLCEEAIEEEWELIAVRQLLESTGHSIIPISRDQMHAFAGNMLTLRNNQNETFMVMSEAAFASLSAEQKQMLEAFAQLLPIPVPTIEQVEGGSVRCMMAEIFLEKRGSQESRESQ
ncbi:MAG TPA: arginine deiminase-related protein [Chitinophagaceae bacterium]|nr:arginine deiminase-related protein [Chitinophagaceae bacterium]